MVKRPTLVDLANAAGVSIATVDRVINRRLPVTSDTSKRVLQAAEAIGYHGTSLLKRRITELPTRRFGFLLQKRHDAFYQALAKGVTIATKNCKDIEGKPVIEFVDELVPASIAARLLTLAPRVDAIGIVAMDHPQVSQAVSTIVASGKPVFTLLSPITSERCNGHFGLDSRKCGRIAGWSIKKLAKKSGKIGILVGSHRYTNQEISEISFRSFMREFAPEFQLLEPIINLDDDRIAYEAITNMVASYPDLVAVYASGGGQDGFIQALREITDRPRPIAICNELTTSTRAALLEGTIDLTLGTPIQKLSTLLVENMAKACASADLPHLAPMFVAPDIFISENV